MFQKATPLFLICETPLHVGSGSDLGVIDLPIQRERHTSFPKIEGSSLKGSLREAFEDKLTDPNDRKKIHLAFGFDEKTPEKDETIKTHFGDDTQFQGALGFSDARLLLFPVKSMKGVFAWITCPKVLEQFKRDMELAKTTGVNIEIPTLPVENSVSAEIHFVDNEKKKIVLEEYTYTVNKNLLCESFAQSISELLYGKAPSDGTITDSKKYWRDKIRASIVILPDDDFTDFVNLSTEVITRTKINNKTGTVQTGALFTEEYLPSESVMYSLVLFSPFFHTATKIEPFMGYLKNQNLNEFDEKEANKKIIRSTQTEVKNLELFFGTLPEIVQIGGNATLGKGLVRPVLLTNLEVS